jgi:hypothetical protein
MSIQTPTRIPRERRRSVATALSATAHTGKGLAHIMAASRSGTEMRNKILTIALISLAFSIAPAQNFPTYGNISDIKDFKKVYVASENEDSRKRIIKALEKDKSLEVVNSPDEAQFYLEFGELSREAVSTERDINERQQRTQMRAYTLGADKRKVIVWSDNATRDTEHFMGMKMYDSGRGESELISKFLKALKKARGK